MQFCEKLTVLRRRAHMTQRQLAECVGVTRQAVYKWERGQALPEAASLLVLRQLFGVSIDCLLDPALPLSATTDPPASAQRGSGLSAPSAQEEATPPSPLAAPTPQQDSAPQSDFSAGVAALQQDSAPQSDCSAPVASPAPPRKPIQNRAARRQPPRGILSLLGELFAPAKNRKGPK